MAKAASRPKARCRRSVNLLRSLILVVLCLAVSACGFGWDEDPCGSESPAVPCETECGQIRFASCTCGESGWECTCENPFCAIYFAFGRTCPGPSECCPPICSSPSDMSVAGDLADPDDLLDGGVD